MELTVWMYVSAFALGWFALGVLVGWCVWGVD